MTGLRVVPAGFLSLAVGVLIDRLGARAILMWDRVVLLVLSVATARHGRHRWGFK